MKKFLTYIYLLLVLAVPTHAREEILSFDSNIIVNKNQTVDIVETITVRAEGHKINRGIYRDIPLVEKNQKGRPYGLKTKVISVTRDGSPIKYSKEPNGSNTRIYMGDMDVYIPSRVYTYKIHYKNNYQIRLFDNLDEFYYNITGNDWDFPINKATARIQLPSGANISHHSIYTGRLGEKGKNFTTPRIYNNKIELSTVHPMSSKNGLTVALGFSKGVFTELPSEIRRGGLMDSKIGIIISVLIYILVLVYMYKIWDRYGRDPRKRVYTRYVPPKDLNAYEVSHILNKTTPNQAIMAYLIEMANKGVISIKAGKFSKLTNKVTITKKRLTPEKIDTLSIVEIRVLKAMFETNIVARGALDLSRPADGQKVLVASNKLSEALRKKFKNKAYTSNLKYILIALFFSLISAIFITMHITEYFIPYILISTLLFSGVYALFSILCPNLDNWEHIKPFRKFLSIFGIVIILIVFYQGIAFFRSMNIPVWSIFYILPLIIANVVFAQLVDKYTVWGREKMDEIEGFKIYLEMAEKDRLEFFTNNRLDKETFEKYLPYAIALKVENSWAKGFEAYLKSAMNKSSNRDYSGPSWYTGGSTKSFNCPSFTSSLSSSLSSSASGGAGGAGGGGGGGGGGGF